MIDLHTHTDESDGTLSPVELVDAAVQLGLEALAISDHDTFAGYDRAAEVARAAGLDLVCGIELSTKFPRGNGLRPRQVHVLGYFLNAAPAQVFREWLAELQRTRRDRNVRLAERLQSLGIQVTVAEVEKLGRSLAGRPHFARLMMEKGYVSSVREAFDRYLGESAQAYVDREEPSLAEGIRRIREAGGMASIAHPGRLGRSGAESTEKLMGKMRSLGLGAIEVYHPDHSAEDVHTFLEIARRLNLSVTGGTDYHGENKPEVQLGSVDVPRGVLDELRAATNGDTALGAVARGKGSGPRLV